MPRLPVRSVIIQVLVIVMAAGSVGYVHAASLNGISSATLGVWTMPAVIDFDTTPPMITATISAAANGAGWHRAAVTVTFVCTDTGSGVASCSAPVTVSTQGSGQIVFGTAVDVAGNAASTSVSLKIDLTAPTVAINGVVNGALLTAMPTVTCSASDALSGLAGPCSLTVTPGAGGTYTAQASAIDVAGNVATTTASFRVSTPPMITATISAAANGAGWHRAAVTVTFVCTDVGFGVVSCSPPVTVATQGAGQLVVGNAVDLAGNTASASATLNIDLTGPTVNIIGVTNGAVLAAMPTVTCSASDALSGLAGPCSITVTPGAAGAHTAQASATDVAGNIATTTVSFQVSAPPVPSGTCGVGSTSTPCVIPFGTVYKGPLLWDADVVVLGEINGKLDVNNGSITIGATGIVRKDISQTGTGGITLLAGSFVDGKVRESGPGSLVVEGRVSDRVEEDDDGDLTIRSTAIVGGLVTETGAGTLTVNGKVGSDVAERDNGDLLVGAGAVIGGSADSTGLGVCTITPGATIAGARLNSCVI